MKIFPHAVQSYKQPNGRHDETANKENEGHQYKGAFPDDDA